ncbi:hypothetical protein DMC25_21430 [Caulobacter sp. D4A]|nr:hypothetical protein DMC25_21430 [Caulobacter sp. D4A]PXA91365.1 hypothetical protein DMC18_13390 [Caulobacter sp. D5]
MWPLGPGSALRFGRDDELCRGLGAGPLRPSGPPPPEGEDLRRTRCSPSGGAVAERLRGSGPHQPQHLP